MGKIITAEAFWDGDVVIPAEPDPRLVFDGANNYLAVDITEAQLLSIWPKSSPGWQNTYVAYMKLAIPADVALNSSLFGISDNVNDDAYHRFAMFVDATNADRVNAKIRNQNSGSWDVNSTAKQYDPDVYVHIIMQKGQRPSFAWDWMQSRLRVGGVDIGVANTYENIGSNWKFMTIGALRDDNFERFMKMSLKKFAFYKRTGNSFLSAPEIANLESDVPVTTGRLIYYDVEDEDCVDLLNNKLINLDNPGTYDGLFSPTPPSYVT